jgi:hypothetical protein
METGWGGGAGSASSVGVGAIVADGVPVFEPGDSDVAVGLGSVVGEDCVCDDDEDEQAVSTRTAATRAAYVRGGATGSLPSSRPS